MTLTYCDLCGKSLPPREAIAPISISIKANFCDPEYKADSCEDCAKSLMKYLKSGPNKGRPNASS